MVVILFVFVFLIQILNIFVLDVTYEWKFIIAIFVAVFVFAFLFGINGEANAAFTDSIFSSLTPSTDNFKNNVSSEEQNLFKAIYRLFILQIDDKRYSFSTDPDESYAFLEGQLEKAKASIS